MADGLRTPYKDCVIIKGSTVERTNLGAAPDTPIEGTTQEMMKTINFRDLPINDLHQGTPDAGPGKRADIKGV